MSAAGFEAPVGSDAPHPWYTETCRRRPCAPPPLDERDGHGARPSRSADQRPPHPAAPRRGGLVPRRGAEHRRGPGIVASSLDGCTALARRDPRVRDPQLRQRHPAPADRAAYRCVVLGRDVTARGQRDESGRPRRCGRGRDAAVADARAIRCRHRDRDLGVHGLLLAPDREHPVPARAHAADDPARRARQPRLGGDRVPRHRRVRRGRGARSRVADDQWAAARHRARGAVGPQPRPAETGSADRSPGAPGAGTQQRARGPRRALARSSARDRVPARLRLPRVVRRACGRRRPAPTVTRLASRTPPRRCSR